MYVIIFYSFLAHHILNLNFLTCMRGDIGVCGIAVSANCLCGISVILILNCEIAGHVFLAFWSMIVGIKDASFTFSDHF